MQSSKRRFETPEPCLPAPKRRQVFYLTGELDYHLMFNVMKCVTPQTMRRLRMANTAHARLVIMFLAKKYEHVDALASVKRCIFALLRLHQDATRQPFSIAMAAIKHGSILINVLACYETFTFLQTETLAHSACVYGNKDALDWLFINGTISTVYKYYRDMLEISIYEGVVGTTKHLYERVCELQDNEKHALRKAGRAVKRTFLRMGQRWAAQSGNVDALRWMVESLKLKLTEETAYYIVMSQNMELCEWACDLLGRQYDMFHDYLECFAFGTKAIWSFSEWREFKYLSHLTRIADFAAIRAKRRCAESDACDEDKTKLKVAEARLVEIARRG